MKFKIYRGTSEIGGTCVELTSTNGKCIWIDLGAPLSKTNTDISYCSSKSPDALLISHSHQDHYGLMDKVGLDVPIYMGNLCKELIDATNLFRELPFLNQNIIGISAWKTFTILDTFKITPFLVDHSSPEAFAFLIEVDNKRVFYSGDFRATGRKKIVYENLIANPPKNIDLLFLEGTMIGRSNHEFNTEISVENEILKIIKNQINLSFVISSAQNIDRFVSVFNVCRKTNKKIVIDIYSAWVLDLVKKVSPNLPIIEWSEVLVYNHPSQLAKISNTEYDSFRKRVLAQTVGDIVFSNPKELVYFIRNPSYKLVQAVKKHGKINIIYSQWEGYLLEEHKTYATDNINLLRADKDNFNFKIIHTSGHATLEHLIQFAKAINPVQIIPIHTEKPNKFYDEFKDSGLDNIKLCQDNIEYPVIS